MTRALTVTLALTLAAGCSVLLKPDRDAIVGDPDAGMGGMDGDVEDGGPDAGPDGGDVDGGCRAPQDFELDCANGMDDDCDELVDCRDFDCASSMRCCMLDGSGTAGVPASFGGSGWIALPDGTVGPIRTATQVSFRARSEPTALVLSECVPLAYGTRIEATFQVSAGGNADHYGALVLGPTQALSADGGLPADLAVIVDRDGQVRAERAGTMLGDPVSIGAGIATPVSVSLSPGIDEAGRAVLRVSVEANAVPLVTDVPLMPLADLRGPEAGCVRGDGLFLGLEGRGENTVRLVNDGLNVRLFECENPSQFTQDMWLPDVVSELDADDAWRVGGVGEPALAHFYDGAGGAQLLEVWVDGANLERADEIFRPVEFAIGATRRRNAVWEPRNADGAQPLIPMAREPSIAVPVDDSRVQGEDPFIAYTREDPGPSDALGIGIRQIDFLAGASPGTESFGLEADGSGCAGLRDPALVPLDAVGTELALFFTCEGGDLVADRIGLAMLRVSVSTGPELVELSSDVVPSGAGYAGRGVFSPEVVAHRRDDGTIALRMWYLARGDTGEVTLAFAYGTLTRPAAPAPDGGIDGGLDGGPSSAGWDIPQMAPFAGNPVLRADSPVLGSESCALGCSLESVGVTSVLTAEPSFWSRPSYLVLVDRTRYDAGGVLHDLIPLLQIQPNDP